jgi:DNA-binding CsgD family transcriptional regulator
VESALALIDRGLEDVTSYGFRQALLASRIIFAIMGGYFDQAPVEHIYAMTVLGADARGLWFNAAQAGQKAIAHGDAAGARRWAAELAGLLDPALPIDRMARAFGHAVRTRLLALLGDGAAATAALADMDAAEPPVMSFHGGELDRARCAAAAANGDPHAAGAIALDASARALGLGQVAMAALLAYDAARHGEVAAAAELVERFAGQLAGPLLPVAAAHVLAWARSDAAGLDAVSQAYAAAGATLAAAEAAVVATRLHEEAGRRTAATQSAIRAAALRDRCQDCQSPVFAQGSRTSPLTPRERQVALLAAAGHGNRQIAAQLGISIRTVESHLLHVYDKLGVTDRASLIEALSGK